MLAEQFEKVRQFSLKQIAPLEAEDCQVQAMADVSPPKWHLAHTTWFFETFVLEAHVPGYVPRQPTYRHLFNSYYEAIGLRHPRPHRGVLSRPTLAEVLGYRRHVDEQMAALLHRHAHQAEAGPLELLVELGLQHEQQHQELLAMDVKYNFAQNPLAPVYEARALPSVPAPAPMRYDAFDGALVKIGHEGGGFAFDNESPRHRRFVEPFALADRLVTNGEYKQFIDDGGYRRPELWLSDGLSWAREHGVDRPLYWRDGDREFTLHGELPLDWNAPVCHVSGYEADAFASWAQARLPTEFEWELACSRRGERAEQQGMWLEDGRLHPRPKQGMLGEVWEWTRSAYEPYPGFRAAAGAIGEYNGKFMSNQWVLRGGSIVTPRGHVRSTYRNFFYPHQRWPFTGIRLARNAA